MGDDVIARLFNKIDNVSDRLARVETMLEEREKSQINIAGIIAWVATTAIAIYAALPK